MNKFNIGDNVKLVLPKENTFNGKKGIVTDIKDNSLFIKFDDIDYSIPYPLWCVSKST